MKNKIIKNLVVLSFIIMLFAPIFIFAQTAQAVNMGMNYARNLGLAERDPRDAAISLIGLIMTFLGLVAVVIMLYGGFIWMTAAGNEDRVETAKKLIGAGVIGLVIILSSFLIVNFVVDNVSKTLNNETL
jgi:hypothetical protein